MSDFQKQTLKRYGRNFLIVCGFGLLVYGMVKSTFVLYAVLAILTLTIVGGCAWGLIRIARWDWWLRGRLNKDEYKAYKACNRVFSDTIDEYLPTEKQIEWMIDHTGIPSDTLWSMFERLS